MSDFIKTRHSGQPFRGRTRSCFTSNCCM